MCVGLDDEPSIRGARLYVSVSMCVQSGSAEEVLARNRKRTTPKQAKKRGDEGREGNKKKMVII